MREFFVYVFGPGLLILGLWLAFVLAATLVLLIAMATTSWFLIPGVIGGSLLISALPPLRDRG